MISRRLSKWLKTEAKEFILFFWTCRNIRFFSAGLGAYMALGMGGVVLIGAIRMRVREDLGKGVYTEVGRTRGALQEKVWK